MKKRVRLTESDLHRVIRESVKRILSEVSADLADRAADKAYRKGREGFGKYTPSNEIPFDSTHGKKYQQGETFLKYRNDKLGGNDGIGIFYPNGDGSVMVLKNYNTGEIITKPCSSVKELEAEYNKYKQSKESVIDKSVSESIKRVITEASVPQYDKPVFIECSSEEDADVIVELGYSDYSSSRFFVGGCGTDGYAALAVIVQWLEENGLIDVYTYDEKDLESYAIEDFIEVEGYYIPSWRVHMEWLIDNHGGRRKFGESVKQYRKRPLREFGYDSVREDLIGMSLTDAISQLEQEGWKWNPSNEKRNGNTLEVTLTPSSSEMGNVRVYLKCVADYNKQTFIVDSAEEYKP